MRGTRPHDRRADVGLTVFDLIAGVASIAILTAVLTPLVRNAIEDSRVARAREDVASIATAVSALYRDTTRWPITNADGPSGTVDRVITSDRVPIVAAAAAGPGAANWGTLGTTKHLGDFLYWNNPDDNSSANGTGSNQIRQDFPIRGGQAWRGPYVDSYDQEDPWGHAYVINARYLPGGAYRGNGYHEVIVLSAGPDGQWSTPFDDGTPEAIRGDDIGHIIHVPR
jgi:Tfp pilus assembly protein PilE